MRQSRQIAINTISSWIGIGIKIAVLLFITKFLLKRLGADYFGMLRYVIAIQGSLLFLDLGLGGSLNRFVSRYLATRDFRALSSVASFISLAFIGLGIIAALAMTGIGLILPSLVVGGSPELYASGFGLMACIGGSLGIRFWSYAPRAILFGAQRYDLVNIILSFSAVLRAGIIVTLFLIVKSSGLLTVGLCFLLTAIVETLLMWIFAKRQCPQIKLGLKIIERSHAKEVFGFSVFVMMMGITTMLIVNAPTFLAGRLYGSHNVAYISLSVLVLGQIQGLAGGFAFTLIPVAGKYSAFEDQTALQSIMLKGTKFCAALCIPLGIIIAIFGKPLFEWFQEGFGWTWALLAIMILPILIRTTQRVSFSVLMGSGTVKWLAFGQIVVVLAIGILSWLFAKTFNMGLYGIALGSAIPILVFALTFQPAYACRQIRLKWMSYLKQSYTRVLVCTIPSCLAGFIFLRFAYPKGLMMIFIEGAICWIFFVVLAWCYVLNLQERQLILGLFQQKLGYNEKVGDES